MSETLKRTALKQLLRTDYIDIDARETALEGDFQDVLSSIGVVRRAKDPWGPGNREEQMVLWVPGETGAGKSRTIETMLRTHRNTEILAGGATLEDRVLTIEFDTPFNTHELGLDLCDKMGHSLSPRLSELSVWREVRKQLEINGIVLIHFDEVNRFLTWKRHSRRSEVDHLKLTAERITALANGKQWPVAVIASGTPEIEPLLAIEEVRALGRRSRRRRLESIASDAIGILDVSLGQFCKTIGVTNAIAPKDRLAGRLFIASRAAYGTAFSLQKLAAIDAKMAEEPLGLGHFASVFHAFNDWATDDTNPFVSPAWEDIVMPPFIPAKKYFENLEATDDDK